MKLVCTNCGASRDMTETGDLKFTCPNCADSTFSLLAQDDGQDATTDRGLSGDYQIDGVLGAGGMGVVYSGVDPNIGRQVAIKMAQQTKGQHPGTLERFVAEAQVTGQLEHPGIVPVYELGATGDEQVFYVMKRVHGRSLREVLQGISAGDVGIVEQYPLSRLVTVFLRICEAIAYAHSRGVLHRDLKPDNIMVGDYGEVLVLDWGLAKTTEPGEEAVDATGVLHMPGAVPDGQRRDETKMGAVLGTPGYLAPEQARGASIDERTDVYGLGGILYSLMTLHRPIEGRSMPEVLMKTIRGDIEAPLKLHGDSQCPPPRSLVAICMKALGTSPDDRYQTVAELQADVEAYQAGKVPSAEDAGVVRQMRMLFARNRTETAILSMAIAVLGLAVGILFNSLSAGREAAMGRRDDAEHSKAQAMAGARRHEELLEQVRSTAPGIFRQAQSSVRNRQLGQAFERVNYAVTLQPENAQFRMLKAGLLQSSLRFDEAAREYDVVLKLDATRVRAYENRALCRDLASDSKRSETAEKLLKALVKQERWSEAMAVLKEVEVSTEEKIVIYAGLLKQAGWKFSLAPDDKGRLRLTRDQYCRPFDSLDLLKDMEINVLCLGLGKGLKDISAVRTMPLEKLGLAYTTVEDISALAGMKLKKLDIAHTRVKDYSALKGMPLEWLRIDKPKGEDLSVIAEMKHLQYLSLRAYDSDDLSFLVGSPIRELDLRSGRFKDLQYLAGLPLKRLTLSHCPISDLSVLRGMKLNRLIINYMNIRNFEFLRGMPLYHFEAASASIADLSVLAGARLKVLNVSNSNVQDLKPLAGMPLEELDIMGTTVSDLSHVDGAAIKVLKIKACPIRDLTPILSMPLEELFLEPSQADLSLWRRIQKMPTLKRISVNPGSHVYVLRPISELPKLIPGLQGSATEDRQ